MSTSRRRRCVVINPPRPSNTTPTQSDATPLTSIYPAGGATASLPVITTLHHYPSSPPFITTRHHYPSSPPFITTLHHYPSSPPFITTRYHYPSSPPFITTLHHYPLSLPVITTLHHHPSSLPVITTRHHYGTQHAGKGLAQSPRRQHTCSLHVLTWT